MGVFNLQFLTVIARLMIKLADVASFRCRLLLCYIRLNLSQKRYITFSYFCSTIHLIFYLFQSGAFMSDGRFYQIEPLPDHLRQGAALQETGHHVITRRSVDSLMKERIKSAPVKGIILGCMEKAK